MIGGTDLSCGYRHPEALVKAFRVSWPDLVTDGDSRDLCIYKNQAACEGWEKHGAIDQLKDEMIYVFWESDGTTCFVVSDPGSESHSMVESVL